MALCKTTRRPPSFANRPARKPLGHSPCYLIEITSISIMELEHKPKEEGQLLGLAPTCMILYINITLHITTMTITL